jgi:hypothetical protein
MQTHVSVAFPDAVAQAAWYLQPAPLALGRNIGLFEARIRTLAQELSQSTRQTRNAGPLDSFHNAQTTITTLTIRTGAVAAPIALLALFFVVQLATINYERRRDEYALLRSRGISVLWMAGVSMIEWLCYVILTAIIAIPCAMFATQIMLRTQSFLQITAIDTPRTGLPSNGICGVCSPLPSLLSG